MAVFLWPLVGLFILLNGYLMAFDRQTRLMGKTLSPGFGPGLQDAITPPWLTAFGLAVYLGTVSIIGAIWWSEGWLALAVAVLLGFLGAGVISSFLYVSARNHYSRLILASMINRYANYVRDNDTPRASAMKELLTRAGLDPERAAPGST